MPVEQSELSIKIASEAFRVRALLISDWELEGPGPCGLYHDQDLDSCYGGNMMAVMSI
jgi:hypothetical protein